MVSIAKLPFSAKCLFRIGGLEFLRGKKLDAGFEIFHIFYAKKRPFFDLGTPPPSLTGAFFFSLRVQSHFKNEGIYRSIEMGGGTKPEFFFRCKKIREMPNFFFGPPARK